MEDPAPAQMRGPPWRHVFRAHLPSIVVALVLCLTLGLAPYAPEPHLLKQLRNLRDGTMTEILDLADLVIHGLPFAALLLVLLRCIRDGLDLRVPPSTKKPR